MPMNDRWYIFQKNSEDPRLGVLWASRVGEHIDSFVSWFEGDLDSACRYAADLEAHEYSVIPPDEISPAPWGDDVPKELIRKASRKEKSIKTDDRHAEETSEVSLPPATETQPVSVEESVSENPGIELIFELEDYTQETSGPAKPKHRAEPKKRETDVLEKYTVEGQMSLFDLL